MATNKEFSKLKKYVADLKTIRSEVTQILEKSNEKVLSRGAKHYPSRLNHILIERNIKSASGIFPFFDLAFIQKRKQDLDLLDLDSEKDDIDLLHDVIRRIDLELGELSAAGQAPPGNDRLSEEE